MLPVQLEIRKRASVVGKERVNFRNKVNSVSFACSHQTDVAHHSASLLSAVPLDKTDWIFAAPCYNVPRSQLKDYSWPKWIYSYQQYRDPFISKMASSNKLAGVFLLVLLLNVVPCKCPKRSDLWFITQPENGYSGLWVKCQKQSSLQGQNKNGVKNLFHIFRQSFFLCASGCIMLSYVLCMWLQQQ